MVRSRQRRRLMRGAVLFVVFAAVLPTDGSPQAAPKSCSDFPSQAKAQVYFLANGGPASDPAGLDPDNDGIACADRPAPRAAVIAFEHSGGAFNGRIASLDASCVADRGVKVYRAKGKKKVLYGATEADDEGVFSVVADVTKGRYFAQVSKTASCVAQRSLTIAVPSRRVEIAPQGVFLTGQGETEQLQATLIHDATGMTSGTERAWFHAVSGEGVDVSRNGLVTASAPNGWAQIVAAVDGVESAPILATVTRLPAGTTPVDDAQVESITPLDPDAGFDGRFVAVLTGIGVPSVGDVLVGTGRSGLGGRVVSVADLGGGRSSVTLELVPMDELLPEYRVEASGSLAQAPIEIDPDMAAAFDIVRSGTRITLTEKPASPAATTSAPKAPCAARSGLKVSLAKGVVALNPDLDISFVEPGHERFVVKFSPSASVEVGLDTTAAVGGRIECKFVVGKIPVPAAGPLAAFEIPVGIAVDAGGVIPIAGFRFAAKAFIGAKMEAGIRCSPSCSFVRSIDTEAKFERSATPRNAYTDGIRIEPEVLVGFYAEPSVRFAGWVVFSAKGGLKLAGTFATRRTQFDDKGYGSKYDLKLVGSAKAGHFINDIGKFLGLKDIVAVELNLVDVVFGRSPRGSLLADAEDFSPGDRVRFTLDLTDTDFTFLGPYNVERVVLVRDDPSVGQLVEQKVFRPTSGQTRFTYTLNALDHGTVDEFSAFVMTTLLPSDDFELEVGPAVGFCPAGKRATQRAACVDDVFISGTLTYREQRSDVDDDPVMGTYRQDEYDETATVDLRFKIDGSGGVLDEEAAWADSGSYVYFGHWGSGACRYHSSTSWSGSDPQVVISGDIYSDPDTGDPVELHVGVDGSGPIGSVSGTRRWERQGTWDDCGWDGSVETYPFEEERYFSDEGDITFDAQGRMTVTFSGSWQGQLTQE